MVHKYKNIIIMLYVRIIHVMKCLQHNEGMDQHGSKKSPFRKVHFSQSVDLILLSNY